MKKIKYLLVALLVATSSLLMTSKVSAASKTVTLTSNKFSQSDLILEHQGGGIFTVIIDQEAWFPVLASPWDDNVSIGLTSNDFKKIKVILNGTEYIKEFDSGFTFDFEPLANEQWELSTNISGTFTRYTIPAYDLKIQVADTFDIRKPASSGKDIIINNVEKPYTLEQLKTNALFKVTDEYDGDITDKARIIRDTYTPNMSTPGTFEIEWQTTNSGGLSTNYILKVLNQDFDAPDIDGPDEEYFSYTQELTLADIANKFTAIDNIDGTVPVTILQHDYIQGAVGIYEFTMQAIDKAGNRNTHYYKVHIQDDVLPVITDENNGKIQINWKDDVNTQTLLLGLSANDAVDGNLTNSIKIVENNIVNKLGKYIVKYEVSDEAGNIAEYQREYEVITLESPKYWISQNILSVEDINKMTVDQLARIYANYENIEMKSFEVITNEYLNNEETPGQYLLSMKIVDTNNETHEINRMIRVFNESELPKENEEPQAKTIWQKIADFFVSLWNIIKAIFKGIGNFFGSLFKWIIKIFK